MTEPEAKTLINDMMRLWTDWVPTTELISLWVGVFKPFDRDIAWKALELAYGHSRYKVPKPSNFQREISVLLGARDQGVHAGDPPVTCPLFILEREVTGARKARDCKPRTSTWACPHGAPDNEADMLQQARYKLHEMERMYPMVAWIIADARAPAADASEYIRHLSWRLTNKGQAETAPAGQEPQAEEESEVPF